MIYFIQSDSERAMHGDSVIARITKSSSQSRKSEGEIVKILSRANEKIVGVFEKVIPLAMSFQIIKIKGHIIVPVDKSMDAKENQRVIVKIIRYPERKKCRR